MTDRNRSRRGGYRRPSSPAAASGPGALSERTDGRVSPGELPAEATGGYGTRQEHNQLQRAAPMGAGGGPAGLPQGMANAFRPTEQPDVPIDASLGPRPQILPDDPIALLRSVFAVAPSEGLRRLINWADRH